MIKQLEAEPRRLSTDIWSHTEAYQSLKVNGGAGGLILKSQRRESVSVCTWVCHLYCKHELSGVYAGVCVCNKNKEEN